MRVLVAPLLRRYVLTAPSPCCCTHQPSIDNRAPKKYQHLVVRAKKVQKEEERYQEIERENAILLSKMDKIASWSSERAARPSSYRSSLGAGWGGAKPGVLRQVRTEDAVRRLEWAAAGPLEVWAFQADRHCTFAPGREVKKGDPHTSITICQ